MTTLFISDLHLDPAHPAVLEGFLAFCRGRARGADTLYVLGDLFEAWIGDDDDAEPGPTVAAAFAELAAGGTAVKLMHGNRDFLLGAAFADAAGAELLPDPCVVEVAGRRVLLMHGDSLCTGDTTYQQLRTMLRSAAWQQETLAKPLAERRAMAAALRAESAKANANKADNIMDVAPGEAEAALARHGATTLVHGHTHRPALHALDLDGTPGERWVLGDWGDEGWCLEMGERGTALERWALGGCG